MAALTRGSLSPRVYWTRRLMVLGTAVLLVIGIARLLGGGSDGSTPRAADKAVQITAGRAVLEASGGLTLDRAREVAETGVDFISVGALTHSVKVFDLGMDLRDDSARG